MCTVPRPHIATTGYVHKLGDPAKPCTLGVRFRKLAWRLTLSWGPLRCKRHFRTPIPCMSTVPRPRMATISYVHNMVGPAEPYTLGVRFRKCSWYFTSWGPLCHKRHFSTQVVWMCTASRPHTSTTGYGHILGGAAEPCTLGVRFRKLAWRLTPSWGPLWCKRHFRTPAVWMCTVPRPHTYTTAYVHN